MSTDPLPPPQPAAVAAQPRQTQTVLWIIALMLAVIATCLLTRRTDWFGPLPAFGQTPMAGAKGIFAFTGQLDKNSYGLFMMDVDAGTVWVYEYIPTTRKLRLAAARSYLFDRYLEDHQNEEPLPEQVRLMLDRQRQAKARIGGALGAAIGESTGSEEEKDKKDNDTKNGSDGQKP